MTAAKGAHVEVDGYWKNKWWIHLENSKHPMSQHHAGHIVDMLHHRMLPGYERVLGYSLVELFESVK